MKNTITRGFFLRMPYDLWRDLKLRAISEDRSATAILLEALNRYLYRKKKT